MNEIRIKKLRKKLKKENISALFITSSKNIYYLTGISFSENEREGYLLVTKNKTYIFTDKRYTGEIEATFLEIIEIIREKRLIESLKYIITKQKLTAFHFEKNDLKYSEFENFKRDGIKFVPSTGLVENLRVIKDEKEIKLLKRTCIFTDKAFEFILKKIKLGISEKELAFEMEIFIRKNGGQIAFPTIVAFGKNSAIPHHAIDDTKLKKNSIILLDFGVDVNGYKSDMTRTVFFGKADEKTKKIYEVVLSSQKKAIESLKRAETTNIPAEIVDDEFNNAGFESLIHGLGHGIGLDIHEAPSVSKFSKTKIEQGMVFTVEPGIYINGFGGVRIEDDILITRTGIEVLTKSKKSLIEIKT